MTDDTRRIGTARMPGMVPAGLILLIVGGMFACGIGQASRSQVAERIDGLLSDEYPSDKPGAAVLAARGGSIILKKGFGLADIERKTPATSATVFRLASVTKMIAGMAVLTLAGKGQLALNDPVTKFLPDSPAAWSHITVRHLLSHTAGLPDYLDRPDSMAWARSEHTVTDLIDAFRGKAASFAPGDKAVYSNSNYILLGAILEKVSGVSFGRFVKANIFEPLGMTSTSCEGRFDGIPGLAAAYEPARAPDGQLDWSRLLVARPYTMSALYTAGACVSSIEDLARFHEGLAGGKVVEERALAESFEPARLANGSADAMAAGGWQLDRIAGHRAVMHGGALPGVCTWFLMMPDEDILVILLSNRTPGKPRCGMLAVEIARIVAAN